MAPDCNMTKRDSSSADLVSPRNLRFDSWSQPMNPFRHRPASEAASSSTADSSTREGLRLPGTSAPGYHLPPPFGYLSSAPAISMPTASQNWHHQEAYPLQSEMSQHHRSTHIFKEVTTYQSGTPVRRLMITEVDNQGTERIVNRIFSSME